jgi:predicted secreted protein
MNYKSMIFMFVFFLAAVISHAENDISKDIQVKHGKSFTIRLPANHSTGYSWKLVGNVDKSILKLIHKKYTRENSNLGSGGFEKWTFKAVGQGKLILNFEYVRPWQPVPPGKKASINVDIE